MDEFDPPLTEAEIEMRAILDDPKRCAKFAASARARWAKTPAGILAHRLCEERRGKVKRRVVGESGGDE